MSDLISDADGLGAAAPARQVFLEGEGKKKGKGGLEDGHVTRQQPSIDAELRSSLKFSGSERLADDWCKKMCVPVQDKPRVREGGMEGGREKQTGERGVRNESEGNKENSLIQMETWARKGKKKKQI